MIVGLAERLVPEPWQKIVAPEKVTVGVSNTVTTNEVVLLEPKPLEAEQYTVYVELVLGKLIVVTAPDGFPMITLAEGETDQA